jgi:hypothetical protein
LPKIKGKKEIEDISNINKTKEMFISIERNILEKNIIKDMMIVNIRNIEDMMVIDIPIGEKDIVDQKIMLVIGTHGINGKDIKETTDMSIDMDITTETIMEVFILNLKQMMEGLHFR